MIDTAKIPDISIFLYGSGLRIIFFEGEKTYEKDLDKAAEWYWKALEAGYEPDEGDQAHLKDVLGDEYQQK